MNFKASCLVAVVCASTWSCGGAAPGMGDGVSAEAIDDVAGSRVVDEKVPVTERDSVDEVTATKPNVSFVPAVNCEGMAGTWRSQVYSDMHTGYYDFTLTIKQGAINPSAQSDSALEGSIVARSWGGAAEDVTPPETCGDSFHWTVLEDASGAANPDGSMHFGATSWQVGEHFCGAPVTNYSLDQFEFALPEGEASLGSRLVGHIWDDAVWTAPGMSAELTRVSCE